MIKSTTGTIRRAAVGIAMAAAAAWTCFGDAVIEEVRGKQRPKTNLVDIFYDLMETEGSKYEVEIEIVGKTKDVTAQTFTGDVGPGVKPGRNRHIVWDAGKDWKGKRDDVRVKITAEEMDEPDCVRLWKGGPRWAKKNIGAIEPWQFGWYFQWGSNIPWVLYNDKLSLGAVCPPVEWWPMRKNIPELRSMGWLTSMNVLSANNDAASHFWGASWRMPTNDEMIGLTYLCEWIWTSMNGVNGYIVQGKGKYAKKSIFLPCAGRGDFDLNAEDPQEVDQVSDVGRGAFYWTSTAHATTLWDSSETACVLFAHKNAYNINELMYGITFQWFGIRCLPMPIRAVKASAMRQSISAGSLRAETPKVSSALLKSSKPATSSTPLPQSSQLLSPAR